MPADHGDGNLLGSEESFQIGATGTDVIGWGSRLAPTMQAMVDQQRS